MCPQVKVERARAAYGEMVGGQTASKSMNKNDIVGSDIIVNFIDKKWTFFVNYYT